MSVRTRHKSESSLTRYLSESGESAPKELLQSELPTLRAVLLLGLHLQEQRLIDKRNYGQTELAQDLSEAILVPWKRANDLFKPPVIINMKSISKRVLSDWQMAIKVSNKQVKKAEAEKFGKKLDKLYDLTKCRCPITTCAEFKCAEMEGKACKSKFHITCHCAREEKLPLLELGFILSQRSKISEKGGMQITRQADIAESNRQKKALQRKELLEMRQNSKESKEASKEAALKERADEYHDDQFGDENANVAHIDIDMDLCNDTSLGLVSKRNMLDISQTAQTAIRYETGSREAAALVSSFLGDLIRAGIVDKDMAYLAVDQSKMQRAKDMVMTNSREKGEAVTKEDKIKCVMFDSRIDHTLVKRLDAETQKFYPRVEKEDHYTITDGAGRYLHHLTKPGKAEENKEKEIFVIENVEDVESGDDENNNDIESNPVKKPAENVADMLVEWFKRVGIDESVQFLSGDSTNSNTGWKAGIITWVEKKLNKKVTWLICALHCNELLLRHLMEKLDGKTDSKTGFSGPLGKLLKKVPDMKRTQTFKKINLGPDLIELSDDIISDLSTDQELSYKLVKAVRSGHLSRDIALRKPGAIVHSRWLTFAETMCYLWMSDHGLEEDLYNRLELIVTFVVSVYFPMWFNIKVKHSWLEGPRHVLTQLSLIQLQSCEVQDIVIPYARSSAWFSHSEAVLQTMLCSNQREDRVFAVEKILEIRGDSMYGSMKPRARRLPELNVNARDLQSLISWKNSHEPVLTCHMAKEEIIKMKDQAMVVPYYCVHTQGIERAVKEVTQASEAVYGFERRDGWIRARANNRNLMPKLGTKKDLENLVL